VFSKKLEWEETFRIARNAGDTDHASILGNSILWVLFLRCQYGHWRDWRGVNVLPSNNAFERSEHRGPRLARHSGGGGRPKLGRWATT
jgi:hypothetical protein